MKSSFAARRKPRAIARDVAGEEDGQAQSDSMVTTSAVKRPGIRAKNPSARQTSFSVGASRNTSQNVSDDEGEAFVVKKSSLSQQAIARNAQRKSGFKLPEERLPLRVEDDARPSYSREDLALLKQSTSTTPAQPSEDVEEGHLIGAIDVAAKFGTEYNIPGIIPTDAEIAEKKARRARLAKEQLYTNSNSDSEEDTSMPDPGNDSEDDEFRMQIDRVAIADPRKQKYPETRITLDDEDILEGFDEFTGGGSGRIEIGRKAEKAARTKARAEMKSMIDDAEASSSEDSDDSDRIRRDVYDAVQTQKAMGSASLQQADDTALPPRLPPIPTLGGVIEKLRRAIEETELLRVAKQREIEDVEQERRDIAEREGDVQQALKQTAENYRRLAMEAAGGSASVAGNDGIDVDGALALSGGSRLAMQTDQRGLESLAGN